MKFTSRDYAHALYESVTGVPDEDTGKVLDNFARILADMGDLEKLEEIEKEFRLLTDKKQGKMEAEITTARNIQLGKESMEILNKIANAQVKANPHTEEKIVGGVIVKMEDQLVDGSLKSELEKLNSLLKS
jgi:F-type H+-transporting ATPase subunit delta